MRIQLLPEHGEICTVRTEEGGVVTPTLHKPALAQLLPVMLTKGLPDACSQMDFASRSALDLIK